MSRNLPPSQRPERQGRSDRDVMIGIVPNGTQPLIGVVIRNGKRETVIAPDEARTLAATMEKGGDDPVLIADLRKYADEVPGLIAKVNALPGPGATVIGPKQIGPHALEAWVMRHHRLFQAAFRKAVGRGHSPEKLILWGMPTAESQDDPPVMVDIHDSGEILDYIEGLDDIDSRKAYVGSCAKNLVSTPPPSGYFYVIASKAEGRFKGTVTCYLQIPDDGEVLPPAPFLPGYEQEN